MVEIPERVRELLQRPVLVNLATTRPDGAPQVNPMWFVWDGEFIWFTHTTYRQKYKNIAHEPHVSLFWPPTEPGGYALIVNGTAASDHGLTGLTMAEITLTKSVLHRPGPKPVDSDGPCASDCRRLTR